MNRHFMEIKIGPQVNKF